jgi:hypothetical protein
VPYENLIEVGVIDPPKVRALGAPERLVDRLAAVHDQRDSPEGKKNAT